jgi:DNA-binding MarR family transcriptional regulator
MSETRLLLLVMRYPHRTALARHVRDASIFAALRRLEARGLIWRQRDLYRLTKRGVSELDMTRAVARLMVRARVAPITSE